ncbi:MAG: hypothetical protein ACHQ4H_10420 [Ktedonobacterales bacterium]
MPRSGSRRWLLRRKHLVRYVGSWLLDLSAGYGFRPGRAVLWGVASVNLFALAHLLLPRALTFGAQLPWDQASLLSITGFFGAGFVSLARDPHYPVAMLAAVEATLGVLVVVSFVAALIHRRLPFT